MSEYKVGDKVWCGGYKGVIIYYFHNGFFEVDWIKFSTFVGSSDVKPIKTCYATFGKTGV